MAIAECAREAVSIPEFCTRALAGFGDLVGCDNAVFENPSDKQPPTTLSARAGFPALTDLNLANVPVQGCPPNR
jgi:hypothetical protein